MYWLLTLFVLGDGVLCDPCWLRGGSGVLLCLRVSVLSCVYPPQIKLQLRLCVLRSAFDARHEFLSLASARRRFLF